MKWLTKSDYLKFLTHPAYLWLQKHAKDKLPDFDERAQAAVDEGNLVETYARRLRALKNQLNRRLLSALSI
jgi:hypothetical protein